MLRTPQFYVLFAMALMMGIGGLMATAQVGPMARSFKISATVLTVALTVDPLANGSARVFWGWVSDYIGRERAMFIAFLLQSVFLIGVVTVGRLSPILFIVTLALVYFTWGEVYSLFPSVSADFFGSRNASSNYGFIYAAKGVASILGGGLAAKLFEKTGSWNYGFYFCAALALCSAFIALGLRKMPLPAKAEMKKSNVTGVGLMTGRPAPELQITGSASEAQSAILSKEALRFVAGLAAEFETRRQELLERRRVRQQAIDASHFPDFLPETAEIRRSEWRVAPIPADLQDRRTEITGPVDRKMVINALNSGASVFMADFEDANSPTWQNNLEGQINIRDAVNRDIEFESPEGKRYRLNERVATLLVRPRGWHLVEKHVLLGDRPISGSLFDFGLFFFHNAKRLLENGSGPYFYLPKLESHLEARLWNDVFNYAQDAIGIPRGSIRATVLIETILAAFEMDEILYELREHSSGLNCGRWDYIFSFIKKFRNYPQFVLPNRALVTMERHFLKSYVDLLIRDLPPPRAFTPWEEWRRRFRLRTIRWQMSRRSTRCGRINFAK